MNSLITVRAGVLTTVQDRGRFGLRAQGVSTAGALDYVAFEIANAMAENEDVHATLEISAAGGAFEFTDDRRFAIAGADFRATLDGVAVPAWSSRDARAGQVLVFHEPSHGVRALLAINGGIDVPAVLGSRSTDARAAFGGFEGRMLRTADRIPLGRTSALPMPPVRIKPPQWQFDPNTIGVLPAPEYDRFDPATRGRFWEQSWTVTPQSDRMGIRLHGERLEYKENAMTNSHAVFPGVIQVPPSGEPIVLLNDAPTTGGYPKIGVVRQADLWKLAQLPAGAAVRFAESTLAEAVEALREVRRYIDEVRRGIEARGS